MTERGGIDIAMLQSIFDEAAKRRHDIDKEVEQYEAKLDVLPEKVDEFDAEFERRTGIQKKDWSFLVFASILQAVRLLLTDMLKTRLSDKEAAEKTPFHNDDEHSDRRTRRYYATIEEIHNNPVPFDTVLKSDLIKRNYPDLKLSGMNHRFKTAGHDLILGLVFGTANIMTKTITVNNGLFSFDTYHVQTMPAYYRNGNPIIRDVISNRANTSMVFLHILKRLKEEGKEGWKALGLALGKELVHLLSDTKTTHSLPIPIVSPAAPNLARAMQACGLDMLTAVTFGIDMLLTHLINLAISYLHTMAYNKETDGDPDLYDIRTRRIVLYSNEIMMGCSTITLAARAYMGDLSAGLKFDFGGSAIALNQLWNTPQFIEKVKHEFISNNLLSFLNS